tara:strand:- start:2202 stop:3335 length:1134 start_codon:yes stop_codon:yes gene_type:complete
MPYQQNTESFIYLPDATVIGDFIADGYESGFINTSAYSTISVNVKCSVAATLEIYSSIDINGSNPDLFFSKTLTINKSFIKKFQIQADNFSIRVLNTTSTAGKIHLVTGLSSSTQFNTMTFLNSKQSIDDNTNLIRISNNYEVDLVRGIHNDFQKINIQGIQRTNPSNEITIGLTENYSYTSANVNASLVVAGANDNQPAGTGARHIRIQGVDDDGVEYDSIYDVNTGSGLMGVDFTGISRMTITEVGSLKHNEGIIKITGDAGAILGYMGATENVSHFAYYKVPANKQLIVRDINIAAYAPSGKIVVYEFDPSTNIEASIGEFLVSTSYQQLTYTLDGLITAGKVVKINYIPTTTTGDILINVNINGVLCPTISAF